jgi:hypothetical protein
MIICELARKCLLKSRRAKTPNLFPLFLSAIIQKAQPFARSGLGFDAVYAAIDGTSETHHSTAFMAFDPDFSDRMNVMYVYFQKSQPPQPTPAQSIANGFWAAVGAAILHALLS